MISRQLKKKFLQELEKFGLISVAAAKSGLPRSTVYALMKKDAKFREEVETAEVMGRKGLCDLAKTTVAQQVRDGSLRASMYVLDRLSPEFNQLKSKELAPNAGKPYLEDLIDYWAEKEREEITRLKEKCLSAGWIPVKLNGKNIRDEELPSYSGYVEDMLAIRSQEEVKKRHEEIQAKLNLENPPDNSHPPDNP